MGWGYSGYGFRPYVSVGQRRNNALREAKKLEKGGRKLAPVNIEGREIAASAWGSGWCEHLESYSDFSNRLPRGRTYVRNGSVMDLQIKPGRIDALVMGSELYTIQIQITPLKKDRWQALQRQCAGKIKSVLELLKGGVSAGVMEVMSHREKGMFPAPAEIKMECSCPDWAGMCKHIAAVLYGVGARLDLQPELLFTLRKVDAAELVAQAAESLGKSLGTAGGGMGEADLADVFGIDIVPAAAPPSPSPSPGRIKVIKPAIAAAMRAQRKAASRSLVKKTPAKVPSKRLKYLAKAKIRPVVKLSGS